MCVCVCVCPIFKNSNDFRMHMSSRITCYTCLAELHAEMSEIFGFQNVSNKNSSTRLRETALLPVHSFIQKCLEFTYLIELPVEMSEIFGFQKIENRQFTCEPPLFVFVERERECVCVRERTQKRQRE